MNIHDKFRNMRRGLVALAVIFPGFYIVFAIVSVTQDYQSTLDRATSDVRNISATLNEHAMRTIGEADGRLQGAIADIERRHLSVSGPDEVEIHNVLKWYSRQLPQVINLHVVDPQGWVRANGTTYPLQAIDVRDRQYYQFHLDNTTPDLLISRPVKSRAGGKWSIPLTRRISNPDGSLRMIVILGIDLDYFSNIYRTLRMGERSRLLLIRKDGWVLMEAPLTEQIINMNLANTTLFEQVGLMPAGTFRTERGAIDGTGRIVGYAASNMYPILAVASMSTDFVLQPWRRQTFQTAFIGVLSIGLLLALIRVLWRRLSDLQTTQLHLNHQNAALRTSEQRYHELVDGIDGIVWEADLPSFRFTYVSASAGNISGYAAEEWLADPDFWRTKLSPKKGLDRADDIFILEGQADAHSVVLQPLEHHIFTPDGKERWLRSNIMVASVARGTARLRGVTIDITKQKTSEKQIFQMAHFDQLTGLPNRQTLVDRIKHALAIASRGDAWMALMLIDVDQFKTINDGLGHEIGNRVLLTVAERLNACLRSSDTLARVGGDEFVVLIENLDNTGVVAIEQLAEQLAKTVGEAIEIDGKEMYVTLSMGISLFPQDGRDCETLMRNADTALYRAKATGRNCWRFFDESMARHVARRLEVETALRRSIERKELMLLYHPQRSLETERIVGVEALLRWSRPGAGVVSPIEFIGLAEETGLILPIGEWVMRTACAQSAAWLRENHLRLRVAVNVTAKQIHHKSFVELIERTLRETGLPADLLEVEITESSILENIDETVNKLQQIKALGVTVAIDDFGTGYSSLSYLKQLPIDRLKIDQSFVRDTPVSADDCAIVRTIIAMSKSLGLSVIAEGVESPSQVEFLAQEGCNEIQGYLLSPPLPAATLSSTYAEMAAS